MKSVKVEIEDKDKFEIKVEEKDLETLIKIIKIFNGVKLIHDQRYQNKASKIQKS